MMINETHTSIALTQFLRREIEQAQGSITFAHFMEQVLYHPKFGYYNQPTFTIGQKGDFITAPEISPLFSQCVAAQCADLLLHHESSILEIGAGTGQMASHILQMLKTKNALPKNYFILEINSQLCEKQYSLLKNECEFFIDKIIWLKELPENFSGIILANELLDALPVNCFKILNKKIHEKCVAFENDKFIWTLKENKEFEKIFHENNFIKNLPDDYESEINFNAIEFIKKLANTLQQGVIFIFDYGYGDEEYFDPRRNQGTLTCFYQHQKEFDPFARIGSQDITAHVNFSQIANVAFENNLRLHGFTTQQQFLFACGLMEFAVQKEKNLNEIEKFKMHQAIKQLTWPTEMGERIKVMALSKGEIPALRGFSSSNYLREL